MINTSDLKQRHNAAAMKEEPPDRKWTELTPATTKVVVQKKEAPELTPPESPRQQQKQGIANIGSSSDLEPPESLHPPGYNKRKRDIVKLVLVIVAAGLLRGDPKVATVLSVVAVICLKEGTFWSTKNVKWMGLCVISFGLSLTAWSLQRASDDVNEEKAYTLNSLLWVSAKTIQLCWGMTLSVFLVSAYTHGHNSLLEFEFLNEPTQPPPSGPRKDPPPKTYLLY